MSLCMCTTVGKQYVSSEVEEEKRIRAGDGVRVELDPELFKIAQEGHGGWEDSMAEVWAHSMYV